MSDWRQSETWKKEGKHFVVEICHWFRPGVESCSIERSDRWNVYAYIRERHPWFKPVKPSEGAWRQALPHDFHGGITYIQAYRNHHGKPYCYKIGNDWAHYGDEYVERCSTLDDAWMVKGEANELFRIMLEAESEPGSPDGGAA